MHTADLGTGLDFVLSITPFLCLARWSPSLEKRGQLQGPVLSEHSMMYSYLAPPSLPPARSFQPILAPTPTPSSNYSGTVLS